MCDLTQPKCSQRQQNLTYLRLNILFSFFFFDFHDFPGAVSPPPTIYFNCFQLWAAPLFPSCFTFGEDRHASQAQLKITDINHAFNFTLLHFVSLFVLTICMLKIWISEWIWFTNLPTSAPTKQAQAKLSNMFKRNIMTFRFPQTSASTLYNAQKNSN